MGKFPDVYGTVTVGARGQVVIPKEARKALNIRQGEKLIVISGPPKGKEMISLIPVMSVSKLLKHFESHIEVLKTEISKAKK